MALYPQTVLCCCFVAVMFISARVSADCMVAASGSFPPQLNCPASITLNNDPGLCSASYTEVFPYIPFPVQGTGINPITRALDGPGSPIGPAWSGCLTSPVDPNDPCAAPSANDYQMVTQRHPAWSPNDGNSAWLSNNPTSGGNGPTSFYRMTLTLDKTLFDYTGVTLQHEGSVDNLMTQFSCNGGPVIILPVSDFTNPTVTNWGQVNPGNCPSLQTGTQTTVDYDFQNTGGPGGIKINVQGNPQLRSSVVGYTDNCGLPTVDASGSSGSGNYLIGTTTNTLRVIDVQGTDASCTYSVTVVDNEAPAASCANPTVTLNTSGTGFLSATTLTAPSTDNCGIITRDISQSSYTCSDLGDSIQTGFVEDAAGLRRSCSGTVTVQDITNPTPVCQPASITIGSSGVVQLLPSDIDGGSFDNCAISTISLSQDTFTILDVASSPVAVTMTVTDQSGNSAACVAQVTVGGTLLAGSFDRVSYMYIPEDFAWNSSPSFSASDVVGFFFEDSSGVQTVMATGIPFTQLVFNFQGFSRVLPNNDYFVHMTINGIPTGEVITCHVILPPIDESGIVP